jgi:hypothetical protein
MTYRFAPLALCLSLLAAPLAASGPMSAGEFESYTAGKTLYFGQSGQSYGVEEYLPDRRVRWSFLDGKCKEGYWYDAPDKGEICFVYEDNPTPQCWQFFREPGGLRALFSGTTNSTELYEARQDDAPMLCLGPEVGV